MYQFQTEIPDFLRKELEQRNKEPIKSFMGLPLKKEFKKEDFCIVGVPYDTSTTNRPGTRFGPRAIREFMSRFGKYSQDAKWEIDNLEGMDYGDIAVKSGYTKESLTIVYEEVKKILDAGITPIVLGGDHLITYPELGAYASKYGKIAMIHFDSHNDTSDYENKLTHGTPFRRAIEDGFLDASHSIQVGIRGYSDTYRLEYANETGMQVITARQLHEIGIGKAARLIKEQVQDAKCIVTFDIDFLDPAAAPGTGTPVAGGFTTYEAMELLRESVTGLNVVGFDLVEVMEDYDPGHITSLAATHIIYQFLMILSKNKKNAGKNILENLY